MPYALLEIGLYRWGPENYAFDFRYTRSDNEVEAKTGQIVRPLVDFDRQRFLDVLDDPIQYGCRLGEGFFSHQAARDLYVKARAGAHELDVPLRVRLALGPEMPNLHDLRWEMLCDPSEKEPLFTRDDMLFSRYLVSTDTRLVRPRARDELRALVVIANPSDLDRYRVGGQRL